MLYKTVAKPILFRMDAESVHNRFMAMALKIQKSPAALRMIRSRLHYVHDSLRTTVDGVTYDNPIGLSAGFDKNAQVGAFMGALGFGHLELGSVTARPHPGNPLPRLARVPQDKSIIVYYGLKNVGARQVAKNLQTQHLLTPYGVSIAKTPTVGADKGIHDYVKSFRLLHEFGNYTTINISCPNVADGQTYGEEPARLAKLLHELSKCKVTKPVYLKLKPDYSIEQVNKILTIVKMHGYVKGVIMGNLTKDRTMLSEKNDQPGGLSGLPTKEKSTALIRHIYKKTKGKLTIIGCGGVFTAEDAYEKIRAGASLVQLMTGLIFNGPFTIKHINKGLVALLKKDGFTSIADAVGADHR
jgi:dihydroorotate dehydrogenase